MERLRRSLSALVNIRRQTGKTQGDVAADLGVSKSTYAAWEVGRNTFNVEQLIQLAEYFECSPNDILGWKENAEGTHITLEYDGLTLEERRIVALFGLLAPNNRSSILDLMQSCAKQRRPKP